MTPSDPQPVPGYYGPDQAGLKWVSQGRNAARAERGGHVYDIRRMPRYLSPECLWGAAWTDADGKTLLHGPDTEAGCRAWCERQAREHATGGRD